MRHSPCSLTALCLVHFISLSLVCSLAVNRTIDDEFGDIITGVRPTYEPAKMWNQGANCSFCSVGILTGIRRTRVQSGHVYSIARAWLVLCLIFVSRGSSSGFWWASASTASAWDVAYLVFASRRSSGACQRSPERHDRHAAGRR